MRVIEMVKDKAGRYATVAGITGSALALSAGNAMAAGGTDFSSILVGLDGSTAVTAILAAAVILALVGFAKWGAKKVGKFFG